MDGNGTGERDNNEEGTPLTALRQKQLKTKREEANTTTGSESLAVTMRTRSTSSTRVAEYLNKLGKPLDRLFTRCV